MRKENLAKNATKNKVSNRGIHSNSSKLVDNNPKSKDIAIVGISCRFPGADDPFVFWQNLEHGVNSISEIKKERWSRENLTEDDLLKNPIKWCGQINDFKCFDNQFFNISPREANNMDPQQRVLLEETWRCIEDSGIPLRELQKNKTSVMVGVMTVDYKQVAVMPEVNTDRYTCLGTFECILANRISHVFDLTGQSYSINAACASSLVALHEAQCILQRGECKYSIVAGVNLCMHPQRFVSMANMMSQDGQCKTFDKDANGYVPGEGAGVLILQRLDEAIKEGNHIYGVLKGSAVNHVGKTQSITAPSIESQQELIIAAYKNAGVDPKDTTYVEAHGTGTSLGDPIEVEALTRSFEKFTNKKRYCYIGSVKTNIGHLEGAAGVAGVIKVLLMFKNKKIPPILNLNKLNPFIDFDNSPFKPNTELKEWHSVDENIPLRAGVSSFGCGGVNVHAILEEFIESKEQIHPIEENHIFALSAKSPESLLRSIQKWIEYINSADFLKQDLRDILNTLLVGRESFPYRIGKVVRNKEEFSSYLKEIEHSKFPKTLQRKYILQIDEVKILDTTIISNLSSFEMYQQCLKQELSYLANIEGGEKLCKEFESLKWEKEHVNLFSFIYCNAIISTLINIGVKPETITATKEGIWNALAITGIMETPDVLKYFLGIISFHEIKIHRPVIPFLDIESGNIVMPYNFNSIYISSLLNSIIKEETKGFGDVYKHYIQKARLLFDNQYTFKKNVLNWNTVLENTAYDVEKMLFDDLYFNSNSEDFKKEKVFLIIVVVSSIIKVEKKWGLKENILIDNIQLRELIYLIVDSVMSEEMLANLILGSECNFEQYIHELNKSQYKMSDKHSYQLIKTHSSNITEVDISSKWVERILKIDAELKVTYDEVLLRISNKVNFIKNQTEDLVISHFHKKDFLELSLKLWLSGQNLDWSILYPEPNFKKCSLPTYSFNRGQYFWIPTQSEKNHKKENYSQLTNNSFNNPLLQQNVSDLMEQRYSSILFGNEFFLADHVVKGNILLPGVAYLEMAVAAFYKAATFLITSEKILCLKNVIWNRPLTFNNQPIDVNIGLSVQDESNIIFEVFCLDKNIENDRTNYCKGKIVLKNSEMSQSILDICSLQERYWQIVLCKNECYQILTSIGFDYGPGYQSIKNIYIGQNELLTQIVLPSSLIETQDRFTLHPSVMDAALQASLILMNEIGKIKFALPYGVREVEVLNKTTSNMWAVVRTVRLNSHEEQIYTVDIEIFDDLGKVCVRLKELVFKLVEPKEKTIDTILFHPLWKEYNLNCTDSISPFSEHIILLSNYLRLTTNVLKSKLNIDHCYYLNSDGKAIEDIYQDYVEQIMSHICNGLKKKSTGKILMQIVVPTNHEYSVLSGLSGLVKTICLESSKLQAQLIEVHDDISESELIEKLIDDSRRLDENVIKYFEKKKYVINWNELEWKSKDMLYMPWKDKGVYLITGGTGGLGLIFAKEIISKVKDPIIILVGRSLNNKDRIIDSNLIYKQTDITKKQEVNLLIQNIIEEYKQLDGIIHCAGVIHDNYINNKSIEEIRSVMAPKTKGLIYLDDVTQNLSLDFFVFFSSYIGCVGNPGQSDYAAANSFMDSYAVYRNSLVVLGKRSGQTLSINWPLWNEGGMKIDEVSEKHLLQRYGMEKLSTFDGVEAFYQAISSKKDQVMVLNGDISQIRNNFLNSSSSIAQKSNNDNKNEITSENLEKESYVKVIAEILRKKVSNILDIKLDDIYSDVEFGEYGFESITYTEFISKLNEEYKLDLNPTIFFEYSTIYRLSSYLAEEYIENFTEIFHVQHKKTSDQTLIVEKNKKRGYALNSVRFTNSIISPTTNFINDIENEPIAIVGMSGSFPEAKDLDEYWINLLEGKDCISEIPEFRWNWKDYVGQSNSKWGGFIDGVDEFDPLFFGITPKEAELMDPTQRLLMMHTWKTIEDAGVSAKSLSGTRTGIFIGTIGSGYSNLVSKSNVDDENYLSTGMIPSIGINRISYFLNINGPSEPIETACSSSLVAIYRAIASIKDGSCDIAIAGGAQVIVTPDFHIKFSKAGMLCDDGRCKTFSNKANGYVRGEGVGVIMLKKLKDAELSGDHIYGVIRGAAINHGGRSNSLTSPNGIAQTELLKGVYLKSHIDPRTITYIECHGTGTELGDPIEINSLKAAFKELHKIPDGNYVFDKYCGIGSVKSNIGHLEYSAGIASVIKVLLQLKHKTLVKTLHCNTINPYIHLNDSPFYIVNNTCDWNVLKDGEGNDIPRRAGVSSFGIGGVNGHVILEEYIPSNSYENKNRKNDIELNNQVIVILSAKNNDRLKDRASQLLEALEKSSYSDDLLNNIAYTLQIGRDPMEERLAMIVCSIGELKLKLKKFVSNKYDNNEFYLGRVKRNNEKNQEANIDSGILSHIDLLIETKQYSQIINLWIEGYEIKWEKLYNEATPKKISLPTYPFAKEHYWIFHKEEANEKNKFSYSTSDFRDKTIIECEVEEKTVDDNKLLKTDNLKNEDTLLGDLIIIVSELIKIKAFNIDSETEFREYGFDSLTYISFVGRLNAKYNLRLKPTIFFECSTLKELAKYIIKELLNNSDGLSEDYEANLNIDSTKKDDFREKFVKANYSLNNSDSLDINTFKSNNDPIAIIGMSGIFPQAQNANEFWANLLEGKDCISEIPLKRWDWQEFNGDPLRDINKTNIKWGGFIDDIDEFDPLFFGISPREAEIMDPQQRLLMTYSWKAIEDAGYSVKTLAGSDTGVFIGTWNSSYDNLVMQSDIPIETYTGAAIVPSIGPSRVSYLFDFHGPSEPIETACSSSLVAIHRAVKAIQEGECKLALAGGVNTIVTPDLHISFSKSGMLSSDGRCKTFSDKANGYVRGEGAIIFLLKKLSEAEKANDHIYGVILSTTQNHGGAANSLTSPNPKAQADLLIKAYQKAGVDPRHVTYIETHGTGTELGDPIEIEGLKSAFKQLYKTTGDEKVVTSHCGIGSVKSNIGHLELAAGAAGVAKVLLQLKYKKLVKSIHCENTNPYIDLNDTPFFIVKENTKWLALKDQYGKQIPRLAGVSSFGFGGVNAHIVIEEYIPKNVKDVICDTSVTCVVIVLSAKNQKRLKKYAEDIISFLEESDLQNDLITPTLLDFAYTLQIGRVAMEERIAFIAKNKNDIVNKLTQYVQGVQIDNLFQGNTKSNKNFLKHLLEGSEGELYLNSIVKSGNLNKLAQLWVLGAEINWEYIYEGVYPHRVSLPTYPFEKNHYWIRAVDKKDVSRTERFDTDLRDNDHQAEMLNELQHEELSVNSNIQIAQKKILIIKSYVQETNELESSIVKKYHSDYVSKIIIGNESIQNIKNEWIINSSNYKKISDIIEFLGGVDIVYFTLDEICQIEYNFSVDKLIEIISSSKLVKQNLVIKVVNSNAFFSFCPFKNI